MKLSLRGAKRRSNLIGCRLDCFVVAALLLAMTALCFAASQSAFQEANALYKSGDFKGAYEAYRKLAGKGASAALYYNLGNAALRLSKKGEALAAYKRALKVDPRDGDLRWNIRVLENALPGHRAGEEPNAVWRGVRLAAEWLSLSEAAVFLSFTLALLAACSALSFTFPGARPALRLPIFLSVASAAVFSFLFAGMWLDGKDPGVVILEKEAVARYGPSDRETKAFVVHEGAVGRVRDETPEWVYVVFDEKNSGWVRKTACEVI